MTQQSLIARLKAVEEALSMFSGKVKHEINGADESCFVIGMRNQITESQMRSASEALSDLRELIKEAEGQVPVGVVRKDSEADVYWWLIERESSREVKRGQSLYTALGEKP